MFNKEFFIRPTPNARANPHETIRVGTEFLPKDCVRHVEPNSVARDMLGRKFKHLASSDYLQSHIRITIPVNDHSNTLTPRSNGRTVPIESGLIPFGDMLGSQLTGKGSWVSGFAYEKLVVNRKSIISSHAGLLSDAGARDDVLVSNILLENGFRSMLHTGYVILHEDKFREWLTKKWGGDSSPAAGFIRNAFGELWQDGLPAYLYRLGGSVERVSNRSTSEMGMNRVRAEISQAANLMLYEHTLLPNSWINTALNTLGKDKTNAIYALDIIKRHGKLNTRQYRSLRDFTCAVYKLNYQAFQKAYPQFPAHLDAHYIGMSKDVDLAHFTCDYDASMEHASYRNSASDYRSSAINMMNSYFTIIRYLFCLPSVHIDHSEEISFIQTRIMK